jgi:hypothetical protein
MVIGIGWYKKSFSMGVLPNLTGAGHPGLGGCWFDALELFFC